MQKTSRSYQTPNDKFFYYNPLADASVNVFHTNGRDRKTIRLVALHPRFDPDYNHDIGGKQALSPNKRLRIAIINTQHYCYINESLQPDSRFSVVYKKTTNKKRRFAAY